MISAFALPDPKSYVAHALHRDGRAFPETNCYSDVWIELLHALGLDPIAALSFTLAVDFEGDQWTFYKYALPEVWDLYGLDTQELNVWRGPLTCVVEQLARGRVVLIEVDAYYLPDTAATNYHHDHLNKTTIGVQAIDADGKRMRYFHGPGYFELEGDDFVGALHVGRGTEDYLVPYVEYVKLERMVNRPGDELRARAVRQLADNLRRRPAQNPFIAFRKRFPADLDWLRGEPAQFHPYAFATLRQFGSCYDLSATFLRWLEARGEKDLAPAAAAFDDIAGTAKVVQMKLARFAAGKKPFDATEMMDVMERSWDSAMALLDSRYR